MLKTAPPETIEQAHAEAFAQLTPEQRRLVLQKIAESVPASERAVVEQSGANPQALARMATRAESWPKGGLSSGRYPETPVFMVFLPWLAPTNDLD